MSQDIPASLVKEIRDKTSAPLLDCKKALEETNGNIDKAIEILKIKIIQININEFNICLLYTSPSPRDRG